MDVVLGAAVTGPVARLALVDGSTGDRRQVIDQSTVDLGSDPVGDLADAIVGTHRLLIEDGHRLAAARVCWPDDRGVQELRRRLSEAGISDVAAVSQSDAALAKVREVSGGVEAGRARAALLFCDDDTATLSIVDPTAAAATVWGAEPVAGADTATACRMLLNRMRAECGAAGSVFLMGTAPGLGDVARQIRAAAPIPLMIPDDTDLAFAHGATLAGVTAEQFDGSETTSVIEPQAPLDSLGVGTTGLSPQIGPQLAYSMVDDSNSPPLLGNSGGAAAGHIPNQSKMSPLSWADDDDEDDDTVATGTVSARPRFLLLGSCVAAAVVIAFAALAVTVAVGIKPNSQQVAVAQPRAHAMPQFFPLPTNPKAPLPTAPDSLPTIDAKATPLPGSGGPITAQLASAIGAPAAIPPGAPAPVGLPDLPQADVGPQLPGWGMPGFVMPPVIFNVPNMAGQAATGWHWVTDGQGHRWWVPLSVMGTDIPTNVGLAQTGGVNTPNQTNTSQVPMLAQTKNGQSILTLNPQQDGALPSATDQQKNGPVLGDKSLVPNTGGANTGLIPDPGGVKAAPGPHAELVPAIKPDNLPLPDKPLAPPVGVAPPQVEVPKVPAQVPNQQVESPKLPAQVPAVPPVQEAPQVQPPVVHPQPQWTPPAWTPPVQKPVWTPPVQQAPEPPVFHAPSPPLFQAPPAMPNPPIFKLPPLFGGGGGGLPPIFGGRHH